MWILAQDKKLLINCEYFYICSRKPYYESTRYIITTEKELDLGKYSTIEKAMEVLNMIEEQINLTEEYRTQGEDVIESKNFVARKSRLVRFVFQMPQDDEVEE